MLHWNSEFTLLLHTSEDMSSNTGLPSMQVRGNYQLLCKRGENKLYMVNNKPSPFAVSTLCAYVCMVKFLPVTCHEGTVGK